MNLEGGKFYWIGDRCIAVHRMRGRQWIGWGRAETAFSGSTVYAVWIGSVTISFTRPNAKGPPG